MRQTRYCRSYLGMHCLFLLAIIIVSNSAMQCLPSLFWLQTDGAHDNQPQKSIMQTSDLWLFLQNISKGLPIFLYNCEPFFCAYDVDCNTLSVNMSLPLTTSILWLAWHLEACPWRLRHLRKEDADRDHILNDVYQSNTLLHSECIWTCSCLCQQWTHIFAFFDARLYNGLNSLRSHSGNSEMRLLFADNTKRMHGIFKAASDGQLDIKPDGNLLIMQSLKSRMCQNAKMYT